MGFDALHGDTQMTDKRVAINVAALSESFEDPATNMGVRWLPGPQHIADALTKRNGNAVLRSVLTKGKWSQRETEDVRRERERVKQMRKVAADRRKAREPEDLAPEPAATSAATPLSRCDMDTTLGPATRAKSV